MSVRAASFIVFVGAVLLGLACRAGAAGVPSDAFKDFPVASEVRLGGDETQTRMVVDFNQKIDMRAFTLADPYRVIIDLPQVIFRFPAATGESGRGLIKAFRYGLMMTGGSRIVIDLTRPARVAQSFVLDPTSDQPSRLVLDLAPVDRDAFLRTMALENRVREPAAVEPPPRTMRTAIPVPPSSSIPATAASTTAPRPRAGRWKRPSSSNSGCCCATR